MKKGMACLFLIVVLSSFTGLASSAANLFYPYVNAPTGSWPEAVAIGDVNGDGRNDVVMTTSYYDDWPNDYRLFVFLQNSDGGLNAPIKYITRSAYTYTSQSVAIGDVNHDGLADVVVGNSGNNIEVFLQNAAGGLDRGVYYSTVNSHSIKTADLNNDGLLDVVGIGWGTNTVDVFLQNAEGTFSYSATYSVTHDGYDEVDAGDVNNDRLSDIIVMSGQGLVPNIGVLLQQNDGTFSAPVYYDLGGNELTQGVAVGDVNNDSLQDIVVSYGGNRPDSKIGVFLQNGSATLDPAVSYDSYDIPESVVISDVNGDGKQVVLVVHGGHTALGVYLQGQDGALLPEELYPIPYASSYNPQGLAAGDINGDGSNDVVLADYNNGLVVLYNVQSEAVSPPAIPTGPNKGLINITYSYSFGGSLSSMNHPVQYFVDWGDGTNSGWLPVGTSIASKTWTAGGTYSIKVQARCANHITVISTWSDALSVQINSVGIAVSAPNGGEVWAPGSTQTIRWIYAGNPGTYVKIELLKGGVLNRTITSRVSTKNGSYQWRISSRQTLGNDYRIRITSRSNSSYTDTSDADFTIGR